MIDTIICGDCLEIMPTLEDKSVDMILADLPYGVTACKWDTTLDLDLIWNEWRRICKGAIVCTATQPFGSTLINSNIKQFRYELIWEKNYSINFLSANRQPLRNHENILVFYDRQPVYNPQFKNGEPYTKKEKDNRPRTSNADNRHKIPRTKKCYDGRRYPKSVMKFKNANHNSKHPKQKPVALFEYLIKTYTNEGDTVLDPTAGSGTTAVACKRSNRHYICIEKEEEYCAIAEKRLKEML